MSHAVYLNLTNGAEALGQFAFGDVHFVRIQSTWCEQKRWGEILTDLDTDFLMRLALGCRLYVVDFSAKKKNGLTRALYQGVPWIMHATRRAWSTDHWPPDPVTTLVRGINCTRYFDECYSVLSPPVRRKLDYFDRFAVPGGSVIPLSAPTARDGDYEWYMRQLRACAA